MNSMKSALPIALVIGMICLVVYGLKITIVHAHGHGGGGHHHGVHPHEHYRGGEHRHGDGSNHDSHYHHSHDDYNDHYHPCRTVTGTNPSDPHNEECQDHAGEWQPSEGD